jgi:nucleoside-diphosphate-sugar epimerase
MRGQARSRVLVRGATGYIGGRLVPRLLATSHLLVCLAGDPGQLQGRWPGVQVPAGDLLALLELRGLAGLAYWYALDPVHALIFSGTLRVLARRETGS